MNPSPFDFQLGKILVPVDFSQCSRVAVEFAVSFASRFDSEVTLLHVIDPYLGTGDVLLDMARLQINFEKDAFKELELWAKEFMPTPKVMVRIGPPAHEILKAAEEIEASSIVISSHGRSAIARFFMGGVAERVVRHTACPVIVLPWNKRLAAMDDLNTQRETSANQRLTAAQPERRYEPIT